MAPPAKISPLLTVMIRAAEKAGKGLVRDFGEIEHLQVSQKGPSDFVTQADLKAEKTLREELSKSRPDFGFLLEEGGVVKCKGKGRWIVDPLDGTTNFMHGIPHFAISIAAEIDGALQAGVIYNPVTNEMFYAERGYGAFTNGVAAPGATPGRLRVSSRRELGPALIATGIPWRGKKKSPTFFAELEKMSGLVSGIRRMGAAALDLAYVAAGRFDGYWESGINAWDVAAGILILEEAGGKVTAFDMKPYTLESKHILASNYQLHSKLAKALAKDPKPAAEK